MSNNVARYKLALTQDEAKKGTKKVLTRKDRRREVTIPAGLTHGNSVKLRGALQVTDGYPGDIIVEIRIKGIWRKRILKNRGFWSLVSGIIGIFSPVMNGAFFVGAIVLGFLQFRRGVSKYAIGGFALGIAGIVFTTVVTFYLMNLPQNPSHIYSNGEREIGRDYRPIELLNNPQASNPAYDELLVFIRNDNTDTHLYIDTYFGGYVCTDYAEDVHNNAELAGIRAAWVGVNFQGEAVGHACNAFVTTDKGLVYIDCTQCDTVAYVEKGKEYGNISLENAYSPFCSFYEEYKHTYQEFEPLGIVEEVEIHW